MPAFRMDSSVGLTSSCSLSSTPVNPTTSSSFSRDSITMRTFKFLSCMASLAWFSLEEKSSYWSLDSCFFATTRVLRPSLAMFPHSSSSQSVYAHIDDITWKWITLHIVFNNFKVKKTY